MLIFNFSLGVVHPSLTAHLSLLNMYGMFYLPLGRTFVFGLRTKKPKS